MKRSFRNFGRPFTMFVLGAAMLAAPLLDHKAYGAEAQVTGASGPTDSKEAAAFADDLFSREEVKSQLPGGAVLVIVKDDQVLLSKGFGYADKESKKPMDPKTTAVKLASVSKVFTATALMQLVEQGKVGLQDDIRKYLGEIHFDNPFDTPVTVEHLLTHTTGFDFPDPLPTDIHEDLSIRVEMEDYIKANMPHVVRRPGETFSYDNFASMLQGYIVQKVTGVPFHESVEASVFAPIGMKNSSFVPTPELTAKLATAYGPDGQPLKPLGLTPYDLPQGGMVSTGEDVAKYMIAMLSGGVYQGKRILKESTVQDMLKVHFAVHPELPSMGYGFEFAYHESFNGRNVIGKGGDIAGFSSWMWLMPEERTGGFIIYNSNNDLRGTVFKAFMDHYYPKTDSGNKSAVPAADLSRFTGYYEDLRVHITQRLALNKEGKLFVEEGAGPNVLRQIGPLLFEDAKGKRLGFREAADGSIDCMTYMNSASSSVKLPDPKPFTDVNGSDEYAAAILELQRMGKLNSGATEFHPERPFTRSEFVAFTVDLLHLRPSRNPSSFADMAGHPHAAAVQALVEAGILEGKADGLFDPDAELTRQEAAVIVYRILLASGIPSQDAALEGNTAPWAEQAVKTLVAMGLYGPEVAVSEHGAADFSSERLLLRKEAAIIFYKLYLMN